MLCIQFCCGNNRLDGWENYDIDLDITKPLPFADKAANRIFIEHGLEHISHEDALHFLWECHRILAEDGRIRVIVPDLNRVWSRNNAAYIDWICSLFPPHSRVIIEDGMVTHNQQEESLPQTVRTALRHQMTQWGHKAFWNIDLLKAVLYGTGFQVSSHYYAPGESTCLEFKGIDSHWKDVGVQMNFEDSAIVEAEKC